MGIFDSKEKREAQLLAPQWLRIAQDCANICNSTKVPDVFFSRFKLLLETTRNLVSIERYVKFTGEMPSAVLQKFLTTKQKAISDFIDRYYRETARIIVELSTMAAKQKRAQAFLSTMHNYDLEMSAENISKVDSKYELLKKLTEKKTV
mgnify:CR=1 FL=1